MADREATTGPTPTAKAGTKRKRPWLRRVGVVVGCLFAGAIFDLDATAQNNRSLRLTREQFASATQGRIGSPAENLRVLLGNPDNIRNDSDGELPETVAEVWCYGVDERSDFPTIGTIYVSSRGTVLDVFAAAGEPLSREFVDERDRCALLVAIHRVPSFAADGHMESVPFNPVQLISAANALIAAGRPQAIAALREYVRLHTSVATGSIRSDADVAILVALAAFDIAENPVALPPCHGLCPTLQSNWKSYPLLIAGDVPLLVAPVCPNVTPFEASFVSEWLQEFEHREYELREPYAPATDIRSILDASREFLDERIEDEHLRDIARWTILNQAARLMNTVVETDADKTKRIIPFPRHSLDTWAFVESLVPARPIRWDVERSVYTYLDSSSVPVAEQKVYKRFTWHRPVGDMVDDLNVQRHDRNGVTVFVRLAFTDDVIKHYPLRLRVHAAGNDGPVLGEEELGVSTDSDTSSVSFGVMDIAIDTTIFIAISAADGAVLWKSEPFTP